MQCRADGCERSAIYKSARLCQKHYFRLRRNGALDLRSPKESIETPNGYIKRYSPSHPLAVSDSYVFEHRAVMWELVGQECSSCKICGKPESWDTCHVDHIDDDRKNNAPENLRILCRACNVFRSRSGEAGGKWIIEIDGVRMTASAWSRHPDVKVAAGTIIRRKKAGFSDRDAVFSDKQTHSSYAAKKRSARYDQIRGIGSASV